MASISSKTLDAAKPAKRTTRSSIRHSLNLASVGKALADVINKEGKDSDRRKSSLGLSSKEAASRRVSTVGFAKGGSTLSPVPEVQTKNSATPDLKIVTQPTRSSSSLKRAGRSSLDETGSKVTTTTTSPQMTTTVSRTSSVLRRKAAAGSALPKYRPRSVVVESLPKKSLSPIRAGTRRKHSSSEEDRDSSSLDTTPMEKADRPISPIPRRAAKLDNSPKLNDRPGKPSPPSKVKGAQNSPISSTPPRPRKTQRPSSSPVIKKTGLPRPSPRDESPLPSSGSPHTPTSTKSAVSRYLNIRSSGRESPSPLRSSSATNGPTRKNAVKKVLAESESESESNQNTPTALAVINSPGFLEGLSTDSADDVEFMLAGIASPSAPTPAIPRIRTTLQVPHAPETPSRSSLHPQRSTLSLSLAPSTSYSDVPSLPSSRKTSPVRRPAAQRASIAAWEKLADLSLEINAADLGGGLITELDLPSTPGMLSPSPSMMRLDSEREGLECPTPLTLPSPGGYASISQVLLPAVTPSPAPSMQALRSNSFFCDGYATSPEVPIMDSAVITLLKLQLASVENLAKERLAQVTQLEEQMHKLKESRKRDERELASQVCELEERLRETLATRERDHERAPSVLSHVSTSALEDEEADLHTACRDTLEEYVQQAEDERRQAVSAAVSEYSERERAERARLLRRAEQQQQLAFVVCDAEKQWRNVHEIADSELEAIRANRQTLDVLRAGLDFFEAQIHISQNIRIPPPTAARFHLT